MKLHLSPEEVLAETLKIIKNTKRYSRMGAVPRHEPMKILNVSQPKFNTNSLAKFKNSLQSSDLDLDCNKHTFLNRL